MLKEEKVNLLMFSDKIKTNEGAKLFAVHSVKVVIILYYFLGKYLPLNTQFGCRFLKDVLAGKKKVKFTIY